MTDILVHGGEWKTEQPIRHTRRIELGHVGAPYDRWVIYYSDLPPQRASAFDRRNWIWSAYDGPGSYERAQEVHNEILNDPVSIIKDALSIVRAKQGNGKKPYVVVLIGDEQEMPEILWSEMTKEQLCTCAFKVNVHANQEVINSYYEKV